MIFVHLQSLLCIKTPLCTLYLARLREQEVSNQYKQLLEPSNPKLIFWMHLGLRNLFFKAQSQVRTKGYGKIEVISTAVVISWFSSALFPSYPIQEIKIAFSFSHLALCALHCWKWWAGKGMILFLDFNYHWLKVKLCFHFTACFLSIDLKSAEYSIISLLISTEAEIIYNIKIS